MSAECESGDNAVRGLGKSGYGEILRRLNGIFVSGFHTLVIHYPYTIYTPSIRDLYSGYGWGWVLELLRGEPLALGLFLMGVMC